MPKKLVWHKIYITTTIEATEILTSAANTLDFDVLETMFTDEEGKLGETENTQPALLTHSSALLAALKI